MIRLQIALSGIAAFASAAAFVASPAEAEGQQGNIAEIIVYGNDPCPRSTDDQVVVCARRPEADRYRIPEKFRPGGTFQERQSWANRARSLETVGNTGTFSCSPVGPGGYTGCLTKVINQARRENREATVVDTPPEE
jgi:hypothetical protein